MLKSIQRSLLFISGALLIAQSVFAQEPPKTPKSSKFSSCGSQISLGIGASVNSGDQILSYYTLDAQNQQTGSNSLNANDGANGKLNFSFYLCGTGKFDLLIDNNISFHVNRISADTNKLNYNSLRLDSTVYLGRNRNFGGVGITYSNPNVELTGTNGFSTDYDSSIGVILGWKHFFKAHKQVSRWHIGVSAIFRSYENTVTQAKIDANSLELTVGLRVFGKGRMYKKPKI